MHLGGAMTKKENKDVDLAGSNDSANSIYEIKIYPRSRSIKKGENANYKFNTVKAIFFNVFKDDINFWFLPEPFFYQLRFSEKNKDAIIDFCNKKKIDFTDCQPYQDGSCDVKDHQEAFGKIMHECSVIALSKEYEPYALYERITHCVFLTFHNDFYEKEKMVEATVLAKLAIDRSYTDGIFMGRMQERYGK
jgi:hypothetical protein